MSRQRDGTGSTEHDRDPSTQRRRDKAKAKEDEKLEKRRLKEEERQKREREKEKEREKKRNSKQNKKEKAVPTLEDIVQAEGRLIPLFLEKCVRFIEEEGLDSEGIYRVPGNRAHVDILFQKLEEGTCPFNRSHCGSKVFGFYITRLGFTVFFCFCLNFFI